MGSDYEDVLIIMPSMLDLIRRHDPGIDELTKRCGSFVYPDGSVQFEDAKSRETFRAMMKGAAEREMSEAKYGLLDGMLLGVSSLVSWAEHHPRMYGVLFWDRMVKDLDDTNHVLIMAFVPSYRKPISPLDKFWTTILFRRVPSEEQRTEFAATVGQCLSSLAAKGLDGEGRLVLRGEGVSFQGKQASFCIDASQSGQKSLNWLLLTLLACATRTTITAIDFSGPEVARERFGVPRGREYRVPFP